MKTYDELHSLITQRGVHPEFGAPGEGWGIEQNPHELATFLVRMQELGVQSCLEIGTGYKGGLSRFLAQDMGWDVTTYDIKNYGHMFEGVHYVVGDGRWWLDRDAWFDLVFIDGDHSYQSVHNDYYDYAFHARLAQGFHDILGLRDCEGVRKFWHEIAYTSAIVLPSMVSEQVLKPNNRAVFAHERQSGIGWIEL